MSKGKFLTQYVGALNRMGQNAFACKYSSYALIGIGMYGNLAEHADPLGPRGTASIQFGNEDSFVEATSLVGRAWILSEPQYGPKGGPVRVGRDSSNDIVVPEYSLSKNHCEFRVKDGALFVTDLDSLNGTLLSGKRLEPGVEERVGPGSVIVLGRFQFEVVSAIQFSARVGDFARLMSPKKKS